MAFLYSDGAVGKNAYILVLALSHVTIAYLQVHSRETWVVTRAIQALILLKCLELQGYCHGSSELSIGI